MDLYDRDYRKCIVIAGLLHDLLEDTDEINEGIWDPGEQVNVRIFKDLEEDNTYELTVITQYDGEDTASFSSG